MNKKVSLIVAVFVALVSIVFVSVFGLLPEDLRDNVKMTSLEFDIAKNKDGVKVYTMNFKANNNTVDVYSMVKFGPAHTTNVALTFSANVPKEEVTVSSTGIVTIYNLSLMSFTITVSSKDGSNLSDKLTISKPTSDDSYFDDDWVWG